MSLTLKNYVLKWTVEAVQHKTYSFIPFHFHTYYVPGNKLARSRGFKEGRPSSHGGKCRLEADGRGLHVRLKNLDAAQVWQIPADLEAGRRPEKRNNLGAMPQQLLPRSLRKEALAGAAEQGDET